MPVWRATWERDSIRGRRLKHSSKACGAQYPESVIFCDHGRRGAALAQAEVYVNVVPRPILAKELIPRFA